MDYDSSVDTNTNVREHDNFVNLDCAHKFHT